MRNRPITLSNELTRKRPTALEQEFERALTGHTGMPPNWAFPGRPYAVGESGPCEWARDAAGRGAGTSGLAA